VVIVPRYWLDADVLIGASKDVPFDTWKQFWGWMAARVERGELVSPRAVYKEVAENEDHQDELARWVSNRKAKGLCITPSRRVQDKVKEITKYILAKHKPEQALDFLKGGDVWVIAHALEDDGIVVTQESSEHPRAEKARIPDVCKYFGVTCINRNEMLKKEKAEV
jgi:hypothetical protein